MNTARTLTPAELGNYGDHLLRLNASDRRMRFGYAIDDAAIIRYVAGISPWDSRIIARFNNQLAIIAAVQISVVKGRLAEFALTVDETERARGLATMLMNRALLWARNRNIPRVCMDCLAENLAMRRIARRAGMAVASLHGESEGYRDLPRATAWSIASEVGAEQLGLLDYLVKAARCVSAPMPLATSASLYPQP